MSELRVLDAGGKLVGPSSRALGRTEIREAMRLMLLSRAFDDRVTRLQRMGQAGVYSPVHGQEAAVVGSAMALDPNRDWLVPASREQPAMVRHGLSVDRLLAGYMGRLNHARIPDGVKLLPRQSSIATQIPHSVGLAWALKLRHERAVAMVYFGEGASSEGDFHESANLAGVMRVPLVLLLLNNHWAISTPAGKQSAATNLAVRADGYGFTGVSVDGNDLFAVNWAARQAVARALAGKGPTLIEARTYRIGFHNTSDNPRAYRDESEVEEAVRRDPIERVRAYATARGFWSAETEEKVLREVNEQIEAAYMLVADLPRPGPEDVFEHVYAELPPRVLEQRRQSVESAGGDEH
jgi:TPP-dependent pyruvate/acetoin dehydrogenase alpha subunit